MTDKIRPSVVYLIAAPAISRRKPPVNLNPLYVHGEVQVVLPMGDSPTFSPVKCFKIMDERLHSYDPDIDFLVWAGGDTLAAVMAGMLLAEREIWAFKWLQYNRFRLEDGTRTDDGASYAPVTIDLTDPQCDLELADGD